jgi:peptidoglycan/LPS O-acetylase OafA/YrhL
MLPTKQAGPLTTFTLDVVRFLCSQGVVIGHLFYFTEMEAGVLTGLASYCVVLFFILSGFLISGSLLAKINSNNTYSFRSYFLDRFFRIYPPFVASLIFVFVLDLLGFYITGQSFSMSQYIFNFCINIFQLQEFPLAIFLNERYMIEFFRFHYFGTNLPLWTIGIEWWMYMFFGFSVFLLTRKIKFRPVHSTILAFLLIVPVYFIVKAGRMEEGLTLYWLMGAALTILAGQFTAGAKKKLISVAGLLLTVTGMFGFLIYPFFSSAILFCCGILLLIVADDKTTLVPPKTLSKIAKFLAGYSYSLYLIHYPILYFAIHVFEPREKLHTFILLYLIVNIIAIPFARLFEHPSKKWKLAYENYRSRNH